jgi:acetyltransferase-like isoleucine patch superfamily enzyme
MVKKIIKIFFIRPILNTLIRLKAQSVGENLKVNGYSNVNKNTILGNNVNFNGFRVSGPGKVIIGDNFHSGPGCIIFAGFHNYDSGESIPYDQSYIKRNIIIENNVWFGTNVMVIGTVRIGEGVVIQGGSVVTEDIPKFAVAGGNPAKVFKMRDIKHYLKLKKMGKFH